MHLSPFRLKQGRRLQQQLVQRDQVNPPYPSPDTPLADYLVHDPDNLRVKFLLTSVWFPGSSVALLVLFITAMLLTCCSASGNPT